MSNSKASWLTVNDLQQSVLGIPEKESQNLTKTLRLKSAIPFHQTIESHLKTLPPTKLLSKVFALEDLLVIDCFIPLKINQLTEVTSLQKSFTESQPFYRNIVKSFLNVQ